LQIFCVKLHSVKLYRSKILHTPKNAFQNPDALVALEDGAVLVHAGRILECQDFNQLQPLYPDAEIVDLREGVLIPGMIDTHVHYPQGRVLGGLGMGLLEWLDKNTLPTEAKFADAAFARVNATEFLHGLVSHGTTTALVFGSHFASAMHIFFAQAAKSGLRIVAGQVVSDRLLRPELHTTPELTYALGKELIQTFHGQGRLLYAVTPRFSLSASEGILEACAALTKEFPSVRFTSHINENLQEIQTVQDLFPKSQDYLETYEKAGLITERAVLAHNIHVTDSELDRMANAKASVSHCPCSNSSLGSGFFPLRRHLNAGVQVALGTDVGGGTGYGMLKEGLQAYFMQQLMPDGAKLTPAQLLYLCTRAGAKSLGLSHLTGDFSSGKAFDAVYICPTQGSPLQVLMQHADNLERILAGLFTLGSSSDVQQVWIDGEMVFNQKAAI
jgi:guanine deaminase